MPQVCWSHWILGTTTFLAMFQIQLECFPIWGFSLYFTGGIPNSLCQLSKINIMDLSYNSFTWQVPDFFSNMTFGEIWVNDHVFVQHFLFGLERLIFYIYTCPDLKKYFTNLYERINGSHSHELDGQYDE